LNSWASKGARRRGWTHIYIEPSSKQDLRESMDSLNNSMQVVEDSDSDEDILMQNARDESELFGDEKSSDDVVDSESDVDLEVLLDKPTNDMGGKNNINYNDDVVMINSPKMAITDDDVTRKNEDVIRPERMCSVHRGNVIDVDEGDGKLDEDLEAKSDKNNDSVHENDIILDDSDDSVNDGELEDFWNALTND